MKFPTGYAAVTWLEELDQFDGIEAVRSILNSLRRGDDEFWCFYSYNPPKSVTSWVNRECAGRMGRDDTLVRRTSYLDVVSAHSEWLGEPFVDEAEWLRETNELAWRWEYLGEVTDTGGAVFSNVRAERVGDARIRGFELVRDGIDWGWFPDPWRFVRMGWEPAARQLTIFEEHTANRMGPAETGRVILEALTYADEPGGEPYYHDELVWCDDTPDAKVQMSTYRRDLGIRARPARKGRMRKLSYEWLANLREIIIDPERCPLTLAEFQNKEYLRDRDGAWLDEIPDGDDHSIDAVRYAMMEDVLRGA